MATQLIDAGTGTHLWTETYDRDLEDIFAIQTDIARSVAAALEAKLTPREQDRLDDRPTHSKEAYALYLRALDTYRDLAEWPATRAAAEATGAAAEATVQVKSLDKDCSIAGDARITRLRHDSVSERGTS